MVLGKNAPDFGKLPGAGKKHQICHLWCQRG